jgi:putative phosphoribosyl transferase
MEQIATIVPLGRIKIPADVSLPDRAKGLVLFAHGSGSSRHSPRNRHVANVLNRSALGTVLIDLLTGEEEAVDVHTAEMRFDIPLLGRRVAAITDWIGQQPGLRKLNLGYFGASTGAAAALVAAAERPDVVRAVVSRGGRPDLAGPWLKRVHAPTLFIVGEKDRQVLDWNDSAIKQLPHETQRKLEIVVGSGHLFEEPGALEQAAALARDWFREYLGFVGLDR